MNEKKLEHLNNYPTVRIQKVVLENFKSVTYGEIVFDCAKRYVPYGTRSDILGLYGQNGSGKTSLIDALQILKIALVGASIPDHYADCIAKTADAARLEFTFDLQYKSGEIRTVTYSFCLRTEEGDDAAHSETPGEGEINDEGTRYRVIMFNEILSIAGDVDGKKVRRSAVIDTSAGKPFNPASKVKQLIGDDPSRIIDLEVSKRLASERSTSFIFSRDTFKVFDDSGLYSVYYQVLVELKYYGAYYLYVLTTRSAGHIQLNRVLPLYTRERIYGIGANEPTRISDGLFEALERQIEYIDAVMRQLVPGLRLSIEVLSSVVLKDGSNGKAIEIMAERDGVKLPLRDESDGVRKIISELSLIIDVYNEQSLTIAIDEFDAGIFEYLLGEILQIFEQSGKGQFIFTSHNLRPLEVIDKRFLYFTTTNPENRYIRLKNIGTTNNLRSVYYREIMMSEQDESVYNETSRNKIVGALQKIGAIERERQQKDQEELLMKLREMETNGEANGQA